MLEFLFPFPDTAAMKKMQGYTLIETLVAVSLVAILSGSGLYGWQQWQQRQQLWQTASQLRDYLLFLRNDANWHNRDRFITARHEATRWCLVAENRDGDGCPAGNPWVFLPPWPDVALVTITPSIGFFGLRNTAWAGNITVQNEAGQWAVILSSFGRIRLCEVTGGQQCQ